MDKHLSKVAQMLEKSTKKGVRVSIPHWEQSIEAHTWNNCKAVIYSCLITFRFQCDAFYSTLNIKCFLWRKKKKSDMILLLSFLLCIIIRVLFRSVRPGNLFLILMAHQQIILCFTFLLIWVSFFLTVKSLISSSYSAAAEQEPAENQPSNWARSLKTNLSTFLTS